MENCLFCKITKKELPAETIYEDKNILVFKDIHPKAPVHFLVVPKKHIESMNYLEPVDKELMGELLLVAKKIAQDKKLKGYKLVINTGREGGQLIDHLHIHLLGGKPIQIP